MSKNNGKVAQVIGPVVDVTFENNDNGLPNIFDSLEITRKARINTNTKLKQHA